MYDSENFSNQNINPSHNYAIQPLVLKTLNVLGITDYFNGINPEYDFEEKVYNMGIIGDLNEPMLNFAMGLINSRAEINIQPETLEFVDDNFENPLNYKILDNLTEDEKYLILSEGRPLRMQWIILLPK